MPRHWSLIGFMLATPAVGNAQVSLPIRSALLSSLLEDGRSLLMSGVASGFVATVALLRVSKPWPAMWLVADVALLLARMLVIAAYAKRADTHAQTPRLWTGRYAPLSVASCVLLGMGTMLCVMSSDPQLACLAVMVAAGILGGIASRNACAPHLAIMQIAAGALPIAACALLGDASSYGILAAPIGIYLVAMSTIVQRHYGGLVALMVAEQRNAELAGRFDAALAHMPHGLCTVDDTGKIIVANRKAAELFGATVEMLRLNVTLPEFIGQVSIAKFGEVYRKQLVERCTEWLLQARHPLNLELSDGSHVQMTHSPVPDGSAVIIIEDVTERRRAEAQVLHSARHDSLTGLANRRYLHEHMTQARSRFQAGQIDGLSILCLDLDGFKQVNDTHGHFAGDDLLNAIADSLRQIAGDMYFVARLGGDEFVVVLDSADAQRAAALASEIVDVLSRPFVLMNDHAVTVSVSIGIASADSSEAIDDLFKRADRALYEAKASGKSTFRFAAARTAGTVGSAPVARPASIATPASTSAAHAVAATAN